MIVEEYGELISKLGRLMASKGVPPFSVAANISEPSYSSVRLWKEQDCVLVEAVCVDEETQKEHTYLYRYGPDSTLLKIEMEVSGRRGLVWDRQTEINTAALAAKESQSRTNSREQAFSFVNA